MLYSCHFLFSVTTNFKMAPKYTLNYFHAPGPVRMMFNAAGMEYNDNKIAVEEWPKIKNDGMFNSITFTLFN